MKERLKFALRIALTAVLLACMAVRTVRIVANWESVQHYHFPKEGGPFWLLLGLVLLVFPVLLPAAAGVSLWRKGRCAAQLGCISALISGFFIFSEGLTLFARSMNANYGYVGAEPGLSAAVCLCAAVGLAVFHRGGMDVHF